MLNSHRKVLHCMSDVYLTDYIARQCFQIAVSANDKAKMK